MYSNEKLGRAEREAKQMEDFRDCLNRCGLVDLGFFGKKFTWCNRRFGDSRTKLRLDRMVANEDWMRCFPEARVFHSAMSISDHCLLKLSLNKGRNWVKPKKSSCLRLCGQGITDAGRWWRWLGTLSVGIQSLNLQTN